MEGTNGQWMESIVNGWNASIMIRHHSGNPFPIHGGTDNTAGITCTFTAGK